MTKNFYEAIHNAISLRGDTDPIAGMVGTIVGAHIERNAFL